ncbi:GGDEF domain-containing protein [Xanthobacter dioxanivorans]|uniref:diguanylate cyclase n=1 Tax=Xanthobacter dioxanivorans TaxID=2528964 RepID=A0A974PMV6_9HYPH|nr:GGDEF domain-containing protein [Xanthobacter dioxanivorans]QRG06507.1 GGDEF domain-containing protein [Xanthobacter dioxanivorans]
MAASNIILLLAEMLVYFGAMLALFRLRQTLGIGVFFCALGTLHFMETYLAAAYYVQMPFGISLSPGSVVLFSGKLALLLLVYIREDARVARQPIYGLLLGNLLLIALVALLRQHGVVPAPGTPGDLSFMDQLGALMVWSTVLLFIDCIAMILIYEHLTPRLRRWPILTIWTTFAIVLTFDQAGFFAALHLAMGVPFTAGFGGWAGKIVAAGFYALMLTHYLSRFENVGTGPVRRLSDIFDALTYRQRYEQLEAISRRDALTKVLHRGQLEPLGRDLLAVAKTTGRPVSLLLIDVDDFKDVNDQHGHPTGDEVLRILAETLTDGLRQGDYVVRYGGDEFAVFAPGVSHANALQVATMLSQRIKDAALPAGVPQQTLSIGVATSPRDGESLTELLDAADKRLYVAKAAGRDRVIGIQAV